MKRGLVSLAAGLFAIAMMAAPASAFLQNWSLDIDGSGEIGGGPNTAQTINEYLDTVGPSYIVNTITNPAFGTGTFHDVGAFVSQNHDGGQAYSWGGNYELTGLFDGNGSVNLNDGSIGFTGGTLKIYADSNPNFGSTVGADTYGADDGTLIGTFNVLSGAGSITSTGIPNGQISLEFQATSLLQGYWFDENGQDLATDPENLIFGLGTTNASYTQNPTSAVVDELAGGNSANTPPNHLFVGTNGQFRASPVPVPGTILLLGTGLLGLIVSSKKKFHSRMS